MEDKKHNSQETARSLTDEEAQQAVGERDIRVPHIPGVEAFLCKKCGIAFCGRQSYDEHLKTHDAD